MGELGAVIWEGPSALTGDPIVAVITGLDGGSMNAKTGPIAQGWILRRDIDPLTALDRGGDRAICGTCRLRGHRGVDRGCYVMVKWAPSNVWRRYQDGGYVDATRPGDVEALLEGQTIRLGAYGDPAALPFEVWEAGLQHAKSWVGYTHCWRTCDPRFQRICMASADSMAERAEARAEGWRTFRIRDTAAAPIMDREIVCPASKEGQHRSTCERCSLCRGTSTPAKDIVIVAHGRPSSLRVFRRRALAAGLAPPVPEALLRAHDYPQHGAKL